MAGGSRLPSAEIAASSIMNSRDPSCREPLISPFLISSNGTILLVLYKSPKRNPFSSMLYIFAIRIRYFEIRAWSYKIISKRVVIN
jgi:hypothetical protein